VAGTIIRVQRTYHNLSTTPEAAHRDGWRVEVRCPRCPAPRLLPLDPAGPLQEVWRQDWAEIFKRATFRCQRCGRQGDSLRVSQVVRGEAQVLMHVEEAAYHG
jgi:DNA-directed RNA polymerase subunit RPC12/RpoP